MRLLPTPREARFGAPIEARGVRIEPLDEDAAKVAEVLLKDLAERGIEVSEGGLEVRLSTRPAASGADVPDHDEGYTLTIKGGEALVCARTPRGLFYGTRTFLQLLERRGSGIVTREAEIRDFPAFRLRGVVEGFYYDPWSWDDRERMLRFLADMKMNIYIYAPKDDPYHRARWREPYPAELSARLFRLIELARERFVEFSYAISPGLDMEYSSESDFEQLCRKLEPLLERGVRVFGLFFDDIPKELRHESDKRRFRNLAEAHAYVANRLLSWLRSRRPDAELILCPTDYIGTRPTPYLETLGRELDRDIHVFWTGPLVCSVRISKDDAAAIAKVIRRPPLIWDNYPVNDYARTRLNLGPLRERDPRLFEAAEGILSNPMNEAEASKVPLATIADYLWNPAAYEPERSWSAALSLLAGRAASAVRTLAEWCGNSLLWPRPPSEAARLDEILGELSRAQLSQASATWLRSLLRRLAGLRHIIASEPRCARLYAELAPYLLKLELYALAGLEALSALEAPSPVESWASWVRALKLWFAAEDEPRAVGELPNFDQQVWKVLVQRDYLRELLRALLSAAAKLRGWPSALPAVRADVRYHERGHPLLRMLDGDASTSYASRGRIYRESFIEVDLGEPRHALGIVIVADVGDPAGDAPRLSVSDDGAAWAELGEIRGPVALRADRGVRYLRIAVPPRDLPIVISLIDVLTPEMPRDVRTTMKAAPGSRPSNAFDRSLLTCFRAIHVRPGEELRASWRSPLSPRRVVVLQDPENFVVGRLEASPDGERWTPVGPVGGPYTELNVDLERVVAVRLVAEQPCEQAIIYEVLLL